MMEKWFQWLITKVHKLTGIRKETAEGRYSLCLGKEDVTCVLLSCPETRKWGM
jgi:hypothetical protein